MLRFVILIPSFNEEKSLLKILKKIKNFKVQIIDDYSSDNTYKIIKNLRNISIHRNKKNIGYEQSLKKGFDLLKNSNFDYIITMDADGEHSVKNLKKIVKYCQRYKPDLVIGNRYRKNRFSESILSYFFKLRFNVYDPFSGLKAYKMNKLKLIVKTINIKNNFKARRSSKVGGFFYVHFKIFLCFKFIF